MSDFAQLVVQLELQQAAFAKGMNDAARRLEVISKNAKQSQQSLNSLSKGFNDLRTAAAAAAGAFAAFKSVQAITKASDQINNLSGSFTALMGDAGRAADMMERVFGIVSRTGVPLEAAGSATQRLTIALKDMGASNRQIETIAETFIKLGKVGGSSTEDVANGLRQMGQALASGQLSGDELKSIRENVPLVAQALADALNVPVGKLKELGEQGKLTGPVVANALIAAAASANAAFAKMPVTFEQALNKMEAEATRAAAAFDKAAGISTTLVTLTDFVAANLKKWTTELQATNSQLTTAQTLAEAIGAVGKLAASAFIAISFALDAIIKRMGFWAEQIKLIVKMDWDGVIASTKRFNDELERSALIADNAIRALYGMQQTLTDAQRAAGRAAARGDELRPQPTLTPPPGGGGGDTGTADKLKKETEALKARADAIAASVNPTHAFNQAMAELNMLADKGFLSDVNWALAKTKYTETLNAEADAIRAMIDPYFTYERELAKVNALYMAGKLEVEELIKAMELMKKKADDAAGVKSMKSMKEMAEELAKTMGDAAADFFGDIISGAATAEEAFKKFAQSVLSQIAKIVAEAAAAWAVKALFGGVAGGVSAPAGNAAGSQSASMARVAANTNLATFGPSTRAGSGATTMGGNTIAGNRRPELKVVVNNNAGAEVSTRQDESGNLEITIERVRKALSQDVRRGGNMFADTLERSYSMQRRGV